MSHDGGGKSLCPFPLQERGREGKEKCSGQNGGEMLIKAVGSGFDFEDLG